MKSVLIDSHQHFWDPASGSCGWMTDEYLPIRRVFGPKDLEPELRANGVDGTVLVQTWASLPETIEFLETAAATPFVAGVVGWVDLTAPDVADTLAELKMREDGKYLVGIRHLVHNEEDPEWLLRGDVRKGLAAIEAAGLTYDLLLRTREIPAALKTVEALPNLRFVIDHIAKPRIRERIVNPWSELMGGFAAHRAHVWCKVSGMITEADWATWQPGDLRPYVDRVLEVFGPDRLMFGSDWPVCLVAGRYASVKGALEKCLARLPNKEIDQIFGASAITAYRLPGYAF